MDRVQGLGRFAQKHDLGAPSSSSTQSGSNNAKAGFGQILDQVRAEQKPQESGINFSKHAMNRAEERGIELTPALLQQLAGSVEKAQEKGAKNILAFNATQAFIINVPYGRVITTLSQEEMKENIFTNIDGAVLL